MSHTPGPWFVKQWDSDQPTFEIISESFPSIVGVASWDPTNQQVWEVEFNARLMAAAPDLLAALERFLQPSGHTASCVWDVPGNECLPRCRAARAAVALARGE